MERILVCGSRDYTNASLIEETLSVLHRWLGPFILVHGACPTGADKIASNWAQRKGITQEPHPANWRGNGKRAGYVRNQEMIDSGIDQVLAFSTGMLAYSKGTYMMVGLAEFAGVRVQVFEGP